VPKSGLRIPMAGLRNPSGSHPGIQAKSLFIKRKSHLKVASGSDGFPKNAADARNVPGLRHQHRLCAGEEPEISIGYRHRRKFSVPFACHLKALNHPVSPPPIVPPDRRASPSESTCAHSTCCAVDCQ
jgi:hypothetical protein